MKIDFYYFGMQCALHGDIIKRLNKYSDSVDLSLIDITHQSDIAKAMDMYYPMLLVVDEQKRYYAPMSDKNLAAIINGEFYVEKPYKIVNGTERVMGKLEPITNKNLDIACQCIGCSPEKFIHLKQDFYVKYQQEIYGFIHHDNDILLGGAEFLPSLVVPYNIPKSKDSAFITCVYKSNATYDYKSTPLDALEQYLSRVYRDVYVISDEDGVFPNGDLVYFIMRGYQDLGVVFSDDYCKLHLMKKMLTS